MFLFIGIALFAIGIYKFANEGYYQKCESDAWGLASLVSFVIYLVL